MSIGSRLVAVALAASLVGFGWSASAQAPVHQVELVAGSCAEPGALVATISEGATDSTFASAPVAMSQAAEALGGSLARGHDTVPIALGDLVAGAHSVRVYERSRPPGRLVACGEFEGFDLKISDLHIGLAGSDRSDVQGVAWLHDLGDGTTSASFVIAHVVAARTTASADHVEVAISKSLYLPDPLEISFGTTVTWVNEDALPHTATATTPEARFDSGYMALGDRFSHTFDEAGEYPYFCVFHPRMRAVVIVS